MKALLISGITSLLESSEKKNFEELLKIIDGIKQMLCKTKPLIVITAPSHENSLIRSKEIGRLSHFGNVLIMINDDERYVEYILVQHPFLPKNRSVKWKPRTPKSKKTSKNTTIDSWF